MKVVESISFTVKILIGTALLLNCTNSIAQGQASGDIYDGMKQEIERDSKAPLPPETSRIRDTNKLDLDLLARKWGYRIRHLAGGETNEACSVEPVDFYFQSKSNELRGAFQMQVIIGKRGSEDARRFLFHRMVTTPKPWMPGELKCRTDGPGDFCIAPNSGLLVFCRDNVAIFMLGNGIDLLSVARDLDEAIQKCQLKR